MVPLPSPPPAAIPPLGRETGLSPRSFLVSTLILAGLPYFCSSRWIPPSPPAIPCKLAMIALFALSTDRNSKKAQALLLTISHSLMGPNRCVRTCSSTACGMFSVTPLTKHSGVVTAKAAAYAGCCCVGGIFLGPTPPGCIAGSAAVFTAAGVGPPDGRSRGRWAAAGFGA